MLRVLRSTTGMAAYDLVVVASRCANGETVEGRLQLVPRGVDTPTPITVATCFVNGREATEADLVARLLGGAR